ncbi:MAG: PQQ-dependent sugar dehydrogenase [Polyangiales bacterium]
MGGKAERGRRPRGRLRWLWIAGGSVLVLGVGALALSRCGYLSGFVPSGLVGGAGQTDEIELPEGFRIHVYAEVEGVRSMTQGPDGVLFVGSRGASKVHAVVDEDADYRADDVVVIADGLNMPNGVAWRDGSLWVAEIGRVLRFDGLEGSLDDPPEPEVVYDGLPKEGHHGWKFIRFGPDGKLYVPIGMPCNVCDPEDERFGTITRMNPDGTEFEIFAEGVRNTVGFDWNPETDVLWFTDNGRDWMSDDRPADELNRAPDEGMHFGFPYCHGRDRPDPEYDRLSCEETTPPVVELGPHVAALGMRFYTAEQFPERYRGGVFIAEHGSWNRSVPIGYRVMFVPVEDGEPGEPEVFARGWLKGGVGWGRPVDVEVLDDGSMLVSDDKGGVIYRIVYEG